MLRVSAGAGFPWLEDKRGLCAQSLGSRAAHALKSRHPLNGWIACFDICAAFLPGAPSSVSAVQQRLAVREQRCADPALSLHRSLFVTGLPQPLKAPSMGAFPSPPLPVGSSCLACLRPPHFEGPLEAGTSPPSLLPGCTRENFAFSRNPRIFMLSPCFIINSKASMAAHLPCHHSWVSHTSIHITTHTPKPHSPMHKPPQSLGSSRCSAGEDGRLSSLSS